MTNRKPPTWGIAPAKSPVVRYHSSPPVHPSGSCPLNARAQLDSQPWKIQKRWSPGIVVRKKLRNWDFRHDFMAGFTILEWDMWKWGFWWCLQEKRVKYEVFLHVPPETWNQMNFTGPALFTVDVLERKDSTFWHLAVKKMVSSAHKCYQNLHHITGDT